MPSPLDKAIKDAPGEMRRKIPTDAKPGDRFDPAEYRDHLVEGVILWRRDFGLPAGPVSEAFKVDCIAYTNNSRDPHNARATYAPLRSLPSSVHFEEGPHDDEVYRLTYQVLWRDPARYGGHDWANHPHAKNNYITVKVVAAWPANAATGPGTKSVSPAEAHFARSKGPMKGPTFSVVHLRR